MIFNAVLSHTLHRSNTPPTFRAPTSFHPVNGIQAQVNTVLGTNSCDSWLYFHMPFKKEIILGLFGTVSTLIVCQDPKNEVRLDPSRLEKVILSQLNTSNRDGITGKKLPWKNRLRAMDQRDLMGIYLFLIWAFGHTHPGLD